MLVVAGCARLEEKERELTFRVVHDNASWYDGLPAGVESVDVAVGSAGGQHIHGWWWPAAQSGAPAVLYLHGARWNLTGHLYRIEQLRDFGFSVFAIEYRGFGESDAELPSERTVYEDARAAWTWLAAREPDARKRYIYGHSLGGAVAVDLAASASEGAAPPAAGLIVESTFTTLADIAHELTYPWLPIQLVLTQKFDSARKIAHVNVPVLIVHGAGDRYVPSRFAKALYDAAPGPKKLLLVEGASHNNSMWIGNAAYKAALHDLFGLGGAASAARPRSPKTPPRVASPARASHG